MMVLRRPVTGLPFFQFVAWPRACYPKISGEQPNETALADITRLEIGGERRQTGKFRVTGAVFDARGPFRGGLVAVKISHGED